MAFKIWFGMFSLFLLIPIGFTSLFHIGRQQSVGVTGTLLCNGAPAAGILVKLYDDDAFGIDDLMAKSYTDQNGNFAIYGSTREFSTIEPKLNIFYHDCNDVLPCQRKLSLILPDSAIYEGPYPSAFSIFGTLELANGYEGETRDCFHI